MNNNNKLYIINKMKYHNNKLFGKLFNIRPGY